MSATWACRPQSVFYRRQQNGTGTGLGEDPNTNYEGATSFTLKSRRSDFPPFSAFSLPTTQVPVSHPDREAHFRGAGLPAPPPLTWSLCSGAGISKHMDWKNHNLKGKSFNLTPTGDHFLCSAGRSLQGVNWVVSVIKEDA